VIVIGVAVTGPVNGIAVSPFRLDLVVSRHVTYFHRVFLQRRRILCCEDRGDDKEAIEPKKKSASNSASSPHYFFALSSPSLVVSEISTETKEVCMQREGNDPVYGRTS
jgi:hypothetical protein